MFRQGLGKASQGRVEPVEIVILPAGKSLDVCAQLREEHKVKTVDGVERPRKKRKKKKVLPVSAEEKPTDMFEFLNTKVFSRGVWCGVVAPGAVIIIACTDKSETTFIKKSDPAPAKNENLNVKVSLSWHVLCLLYNS